MEADFKREYDVDLVSELRTMTWRKFQVYLRCLSPQSHTVSRLQADRYIGGKRGDEAVMIQGKQNVDRWFESQFS